MDAPVALLASSVVVVLTFVAVGVLVARRYLLWGLGRRFIAEPSDAPAELAWMMAEGPLMQVVDEPAFFAFVPAGRTPDRSGIIIFPEAFVHELAYASFARGLADEGRRVVVVMKPPLRIPLLFYERASRAIDHFRCDSLKPSPNSWAIGGHGLGAQAAGMYMKRGAHRIEASSGVVIMGSCLTLVDLFGVPTRALLVTAENDPATSDSLVDLYSHRVPQNASEFRWIAGGNHCGFGNYAPRELLIPIFSKDGPRGISASEQQAKTIRFINRWMDNAG